MEVDFRNMKLKLLKVWWCWMLYIKFRPNMPMTLPCDGTAKLENADRALLRSTDILS